MTVITRFAPSPTGLLHPGHAYAAYAAFGLAERLGGTCLLRIENIDPTRCKDENIPLILDDLHWLGLAWPEPVRIQSHHMDDYRQAIDKLHALDMLYPCFCTRAEIAAAQPQQTVEGPDGPIYPGTCRHLGAAERQRRMDAGVPHSWRLKTDKALAHTGALTWQDMHAGTVPVEGDFIGDVILVRKETPTSYHLSVTVDDALQGITHVTRGMDMFGATGIHRILQALLDLPTPTYNHHPLMIDPTTGKRYAKSYRSVTLQELRAGGKTRADVRHMVGLD
ncbi:MAG: tRNA glutamyl-Q(34) synthetase GluQRS [Proteobacteria bacterium]|nr:tRNA glutamyl-Q(34) synthetase GluQRS [Pseudomonadota bacterium]